MNLKLLHNYRKSTFLLVTIFTILLQSILSFSYEADFEDLYNLQVSDLTIEIQTQDIIVGTVTITNISDSYYSDLSLGTELYLKPTEKTSNLINKQFSEIELPKNGAYTFRFEHKVPTSLPLGNYDFLVRLYSRTGIPLEFDWITFQDFGSNSSVFLSNDPLYSHLEKDGEKLDELSGPTYNKGESPLQVLLLKNNSSKEVTAIPIVEIYARSYLTNIEPIDIIEIDPIVFKANEQKEVKINIPPQTIPESYLTSLYFIDQENSSQISGEFEARYVVKGPSAKILSQFVKADELNLIVNNYLIGPADDSIIENATLLIDVYNAETGNKLNSYSQDVSLDENETLVETTIPLEENIKIYRVESNIVYNDDILDSTSSILNIDIITKEIALEDLLEEAPSNTTTGNIDGKDLSEPSPPEASNNYILPIVLLILAVVVFVLIGIFKNKKNEERNKSNKW